MRADEDEQMLMSGLIRDLFKMHLVISRIRKI